MKKQFLLAVMVILGAWISSAEPTAEHPDRNIDKYFFIDGDVGLKGYDPVGYFAEGGQTAQLGLTSITSTYGGVTYRFVSEENRLMFEANPTKYEPTYGGWCAWARANDAYAEITPQHWSLTKLVGEDRVQLIEDDGTARRLHLF